jgi:hypothetical protein
MVAQVFREVYAGLSDRLMGVFDAATSPPTSEWKAWVTPPEVRNPGHHEQRWPSRTGVC